MSHAGAVPVEVQPGGFATCSACDGLYPDARSARSHISNRAKREAKARAMEAGK